MKFLEILAMYPPMPRLEALLGGKLQVDDPLKREWLADYIQQRQQEILQELMAKQKKRGF